jgi:hypothetical protein
MKSMIPISSPLLSSPLPHALFSVLLLSLSRSLAGLWGQVGRTVSLNSHQTMLHEAPWSCCQLMALLHSLPFQRHFIDYNARVPVNLAQVTPDPLCWKQSRTACGESMAHSDWLSTTPPDYIICA